MQRIEQQVKETKQKPPEEQGLDPIYLAHSKLLCYCALQYPKYQVGMHHRMIANYLEAVERGEINRLIIATPPRHGKTMLVSQYFPAWYLGRHPSRQIIAATYSGEKAGDVGREVRNQLIDPLHQQVFPHCQISKDSASVKKFSTTKYGNYFSVGLGGAIVGRGANLFLIDDPVKGRENAESETRRRQMKQWYEGVAYTRLMPEPNAIVIIATRWHDDDLSGWLIKEHTHENWIVLRLPAIADNRNDPLGRNIGDALWPDWFDEKYLLNVKETVGTREWSAQYQQIPILAEGGIINLDWFKRYQVVEGQIALPDAEGNLQFERVKRTIQSWDTAYKAKELNDPNVCTTWKVTKKGYFLWDVFVKRMEYPELKKEVGRQHTRHNPNAILIEDKSSGQSLIQEFRTTGMPIISMMPVADKITRMSIESDTIEAGKVYLPESAPWLVDYESESGMFPYGQFDDQVDSTSQFLNWIRRKGLYRKRNLQFWK